VADAAELAETAAGWIATALAEAAASGIVTMALAGGSTPQPVYRRLAEPRHAGQVPWERLEVYFGDERAVPPDQPESNYRMAFESLLGRVPVKRERVHRMEAEQRDLETAGRAYAALLPASLDLLLLGVGADGHIASLFPYAPALTERRRKVLAVTGGEPLIQRLTVTPVVIDAARRVLVLVAGSDKAAVVARALEGPYHPALTPAQLARQGTWIMDRAAAGRLADIAG
jgi:6-phosphogluconolactonase